MFSRFLLVLAAKRERSKFVMIFDKICNIFTNSQLPDKGTWHGILTRFILDYSTVNSTSREDVERQLEVFNNASNYTATVRGLRLDEKYVVEVRMCTRVGCGPKSQPVYISSEIPSSEGIFIYIYEYTFTVVL